MLLTPIYSLSVCFSLVRMIEGRTLENVERRRGLQDQGALTVGASFRTVSALNNTS